MISHEDSTYVAGEAGRFGGDGFADVVEIVVPS